MTPERGNLMLRETPNRCYPEGLSGDQLRNRLAPMTPELTPLHPASPSLA
jgi:hypothetical protein